MANAKRGYVPIEIGGEEYILRLDFDAIATADGMLKESLLQALATGRFDALRTAIMVGLKNPMNDRQAPKEAVAKLRASERAYYLDTVLQALYASGAIPEESEEDEEPGEASASNRGKQDDGASTTTK